MGRYTLLALAWALFAVLAKGQSADLPGFPRLSSEREPNSFALADLDGDARLDVVIPSKVTKTISVLRGDGWGDFARHDIALGPSVPFLLDEVAIGDVDGMFGLDFVVSGPENVLLALLDDGAGGFAQVPSVSLEPHDVLAGGDFNGDGRLDVVTCDGGVPGTCWIYLGDGAGSFTLHDEVETTLHVSVTVEDVDVDGIDDLVLAERQQSGPSRLSVHLNDGSGSFLPPAVYLLGGNPHDVTFADVNGDLRPDMFVIEGAAALLMYLNDPVAMFAPPVEALTVAGPDESLSSVAFGDVDGDGEEDLFVAAHCSDFFATSERTLRVLRGEGGGVFTPWTTTNMGVSAADFEVADIDCDGQLDVVAQTYHGVTWVRGANDATFPAGRIRGTGDMDPRSFDLGDLDGDGDIDALVPHEYKKDLAVWHENDGSGQLEWIEYLGSPMQFPIWVTLGDLDADGDADIVVSGDLTQAILVEDGRVEYQPAMPSLGIVKIADIDGDGRPDLVGTGATALGDGAGGFTQVLSYGGGNAVDAADVDGDGFLDIVVVQGDESQVAIVYSQPILETVLWDTIDDVESGAVGDFNEDGFVDVAVASDTGFVEVVFGDGQRGVLDRQLIEVDGKPEDLVAVDIDRDGLLDLVGVDASVETVVFLRGVPGGLGDEEHVLTSGADFMEVADMTGDGHVDVVTVGRSSGRVATSPFVAPPPTSSTGGGIGGMREPLLKLRGNLRANTDASLVVKNGPPNAAGVVALGFEELNVPFAGGVVVPSIDVLITDVSTSADGAWSVSGAWPTGVPADSVFWLQAWFGDDTVPAGWLASDGVEVTVP